MTPGTFVMYRNQPARIIGTFDDDSVPIQIEGRDGYLIVKVSELEER